MLIGVVGKPSCGKSTFFKAATLAEVDIANYPFTTIKPNHGTGYVSVECAEKHFGVKCNPRFGYCIDGKRFVPVDLMDVAGLVPGAHEGKGMGNQFLDDLRQADVLVHVIDCSGSTNEKGESVDAGSYDPANDIKFLEDEIDFWYVGIMKRGWDKFTRETKQTNQDFPKALEKRMSGLKITEDMVKDVLKKLNLDPSKITGWSEDDVMNLAVEFRKLTKPMIIACNKVDTAAGKENFKRLKEQFNDQILVACSAESELALREAAKANLIDYVPGSEYFETVHAEKLSEQQKNALDFIKTDVLDEFGSTGVQQVLDDAVFGLLKYIAIFPGGVNKLADKDGNVLPDCFLLPPGSTAIDFAYHLHTDIGDNFIKAIDAKTKMTVGKEHVLKNGDVVEIAVSK